MKKRSKHGSKFIMMNKEQQYNYLKDLIPRMKDLTKK